MDRGLSASVQCNVHHQVMHATKTPHCLFASMMQILDTCSICLGCKQVSSAPLSSLGPE